MTFSESTQSTVLVTQKIATEIDTTSFLRGDLSDEQVSSVDSEKKAPHHHHLLREQVEKADLGSESRFHLKSPWHPVLMHSIVWDFRNLFAGRQMHAFESTYRFKQGRVVTSVSRALG